MQKVLIIAHRGSSGTERENTIKAFEKALKFSDMVEFDVNITKDKKFIVFHDYYLKRITKIKGKLTDFSLRQIKKIDEKIPTLKECMYFFKNKKIKLNIELKDTVLGHEKDFCNIIKNYRNILISSSNLEILERLRKIDKKLKLGLLFMKYSFKLILFARKINAFSMHPYKIRLKKELVFEAHKNNMKVYVWAVNSKIYMKKFIGYNVDGIMTNYPEKLRDVINEMRKDSN